MNAHFALMILECLRKRGSLTQKDNLCIQMILHTTSWSRKDLFRLDGGLFFHCVTGPWGLCLGLRGAMACVWRQLNFCCTSFFKISLVSSGRSSARRIRIGEKIEREHLRSTTGWAILLFYALPHMVCAHGTMWTTLLSCTAQTVSYHHGG